MITLADRLEIDDATVRETRDGYLVADAKTARTGIQVYAARDLGLTDRAPSAPVRVYRPPAAVFADKAMASMAYRPMTNDHPGEDVTAKNWKRLSVGAAGGDVVRDGGFVRVPLVMMDADAISDFRAGKRELSWGYTCEVTMKDGVVPDGELDAGQAYDAEMSDISCNHIALCTKARGGDMLTFGAADHQPAPGAPAVNTKTIIVDGLNVVVTDDAERAIQKLQGIIDGLKADVTKAQEAAGAQAALVATRDGEIVTLKQAVADAAVTPEKMAEMVQARTALEAAAKPLLGDSYDFKGKSDADVRRAAVVAKIGDAAVSMDDAAVAGAFVAVAAGAVSDGSARRDPIADSLSGGLSAKDSAKRAEDARLKMIKELKDGAKVQEAA